VGLSKRFDEVTALDGLDLVAGSGQVTASLGPNGAGKTTFIGRGCDIGASLWRRVACGGNRCKL
jgi:ABC-type uncharacterized transport system ATPase subunit